MQYGSNSSMAIPVLPRTEELAVVTGFELGLVFGLGLELGFRFALGLGLGLGFTCAASSRRAEGCKGIRVSPKRLRTRTRMVLMRTQNRASELLFKNNS